MDHGAGDQTDLDYLLGVGAAPPGASPAGPGGTAGAAGAATNGLSLTGGGTLGSGSGGGTVSGAGANDGGGGTGSEAGDGAADSSGGGGTGGIPDNPKKRPLEDKKTRDRKRILRNRQLARVSNERRKVRIKAMEDELNETRQTVSTLEESIRCLEEENKELKKLLQGKTDVAGPAAVHPPPPPPPHTAPGVPAVPPPAGA